MASPHTKHGRYSKDLPTALAARFEDAQADEELLSVRQDIMLLDALLKAKLINLDTGESGAAWSEVKKLVKKSRLAYKSESYGSLEDALDTMEDLADGRILHYETEAEIRAGIEQRRKLVETEQRISLQGDRALGVEQVMLLMAQVLDVIKAVVVDKEQRHAIAIGLQEIISIPESVESAD